MSGCVARDDAGRVCGAPGILVDTQRGGVVCVAHVQQTPLLRFSIRRAMGYPQAFLTAALAELTDDALAVQLGCEPTVVWRLRLCRRPGPDQWDADVARMAAAIGCDPARLATLLRSLPASPQC